MFEVIRDEARVRKCTSFGQRRMKLRTRFEVIVRVNQVVDLD